MNLIEKTRAWIRSVILDNWNTQNGVYQLLDGAQIDKARKELARKNIYYGWWKLSDVKRVNRKAREARKKED